MARALLWIACAVALAGNAIAQDKPAAAPEDEAPAREKLYEYTSDFSAGTVSAGGIVGLTQSAIEEVQSSQDLVVALKPFTSGQSKSGYGIALSPFRTALMPMSAKDYLYGGIKNRILGQLTLSYAENSVQIAGTTWRKSGFSADTSFYLNVKDDPVHYGAKAFKNCPEFDTLEENMGNTLLEDPEADVSDLQKKMIEARKTCFDNEKNKARWNADRIQVSFGGGRIQRDDGVGGHESLGRALTLAGLFSAGKQGALQAAWRRTSQEVDIATLGTGTVGHKSSRLIALRYTYGSEDRNGDTKVLAEASDAKSSEVTVSNAVYKYAVGLDHKLAKGVWLQFRLGRNRTLDGTGMQTTALAQVSLAPGAGLFK